MTDLRLAVYHRDTGIITMILELSETLVEEVLLNIPYQHLAAEVTEEVTAETHYMDVENEDTPTLYPPKPHPAAQWVGSEWFDPRTPSEVEEELREQRSAANLTKNQLLTKLLVDEVITPETMIEAAQGVPTGMREALAALPPELQAFVITEWVTRSTFNRNDQVVAIAAIPLGLSGDYLDQIFQVERTPWAT